MGDMERRAYMDLQKWLDEVLGEDEEDGTGYGLVSDVMYAVEVIKRHAVKEALTEAADEVNVPVLSVLRDLARRCHNGAPDPWQEFYDRGLSPLLDLMADRLEQTSRRTTT